MAKKIKVEKEKKEYNQSDIEKKSTGIITILGWIFGILIMLSGFVGLFDEFLMGLTMILAGLIIFPPFGNFLRKQFNFNLSRWARVGIFFLIIIVGGMISAITETEEYNAEEISAQTNENNLNTEIENNNAIDNQLEKENVVETQKEIEEPSIIEEVKISLGEKNALLKAKTYLSTMAFSREGLIQQLEFEGFTTEQAEYGVENCGADWNKQAVLKTKTYLTTMAFSQKGLIEQLEFEGFTTEQAKYGVNNNEIDWNEQAALKAKTYLNTMAFSREGLIEQLEFEGFTTEQAKYGVKSVGYD